MLATFHCAEGMAVIVIIIPLAVGVAIVENRGSQCKVLFRCIIVVGWAGMEITRRLRGR